ncbi:hypothetical protein BXZ70DRAFT_283322 [Cristinia sonorae]|uniref:Uncharacterized protein n=1 Tax=Cristinia sonorae TaxID=1940300 RepID=A0A8K0UXY6_9AGAR|nr:hypothetical protein BXZ70DRAFT_283322 [Cristinia sonorae]
MAAVLLAARLWYVCEWPDTNPVMIFLVAIDLAFGIAAAVRFTVKYPNAEQLQSRWAVYSNRFTPHQAAKHFYGGLWAVMAFTSFILFCEISRWAYRSYRQMLKDRRNSQAPLKLDRLSRPMAGGHLEPTQRQSVLQDVAAV